MSWYSDDNTCTIGVDQLSAIGERAEITDGIPLDRLREMCEAERDGQCVVLPCKVGDTVYVVEEGSTTIKTNVVADYHMWSLREGMKLRIALQEPDRYHNRTYYVGEVGKTIFLSHSEAEAALAEPVDALPRQRKKHDWCSTCVRMSRYGQCGNLTNMDIGDRNPCQGGSMYIARTGCECGSIGYRSLD